jgi:3-hydroxybutyryl-CoA dehydrogenase
MQIVLNANPQQTAVFLSRTIPETVTIYRKGIDVLPAQADAWFDLCFETDGAAFPEITNAPVFVNAVLTTTEVLPDNYIRINAWNSFLERSVMEVVPAKNKIAFESILSTLGWNYQIVPDVPGMIAARVIAMIINEAYFAWGDEVSSKQDIDTAMKLGTNYPYGPFEWCTIIGIQSVHKLLQLLATDDDRYTPAPALIAEALSKKVVS